jgi:penicillin amidase
MFAVGYVSAQDRLWQMDLARRAATGRLAEILGENALKPDLLVRTLGIEQIARRQLTMLSPESTAALASFSEGVNACVDIYPRCRQVPAAQTSGRALAA